MAQKQMTIRQLRKRFPDDDTCLEHIFRIRYGKKHECAKCGKEARYYRVKKRRAYECEHCGHQVYPTKGTPFERTRTPLTDWFHAMFLFCSSRNGVAAKELERQLGVTYKTAWRMGHEIRKYMAYIDGDAPRGGPGNGPVEIDKAFFGGKDRRGHDDKTVVLGMKERGGEVISRIVKSRRTFDVVPIIVEYVRPRARVYTDEAHAWNDLRGSWEYDHQAVNHSKKEWVRGEVSVNSLEGYWAGVKRMIKGTHIWVSRKHLQKYLCEAEYRHNLRKTPALMMELLLRAFPGQVYRAPLRPAGD